MALTEVVRLRLEGKGFNELFMRNRKAWTFMAEKARKLIAEQIDGREPTIDDIKKTLLPLVELRQELRGFLDQNKLTQKYWVTDFTDYLLDRVYEPTLKKLGG